MMETKKEYRYFSIFSHEKEENYLRQRHSEGWRFVRVSGLGTYHFERCEPENVVYQLDYNPQSKETREEYLKMFADCGWEHLQEYAGYSYFRKPVSQMKGEEQIFSDNDSRVAMMARVFKGRLGLPLWLIWVCLLPQFIINLSNGNYMICAFLGSVLFLYAAVFSACGICYYRLKNKKK